MKRTMLALCLIFAALSFAQDQHGEKQITIVGQVIDTGCYFAHDSKGEAHAACAATCAKGGIPLAILDDSGKVYLPIAADHKNQNLKLIPFVEKRVKVTGTLFDRNGIEGIAIRNVESAQ